MVAPLTGHVPDWCAVPDNALPRVESVTQLSLINSRFHYRSVQQDDGDEIACAGQASASHDWIKFEPVVPAIGPHVGLHPKQGQTGQHERLEFWRLLF